MSFELTQKVLRNQLDINLYEKLLLAILADKIDHKGFCYPSFNTLAKIGGMSRSTVIRNLQGLVRYDLITVTKIKGVRNQYKILENFLDKRIDAIKKGELTSVTQTLALVSQGHPPSVTQTPHQCQTDTLVTKVVDNEVSKGSKVISKNKITKQNLNLENVGKEMNIEDIDLAKFEKTNKKKMNPIDVWRNACVDFQNENLLTIVNLKFTQVQAGIMNKAAKKLEGGFPQTVEHAVTNWGAFVKYVNLHSGGAKKPVSPEITFFVYHSNLALQFFQKKSDTKIKKEKKIPVTKKKVTDAHTKALLKAVGKYSGD